MRQRIAENRQQFLGLELLCGEGALVPRPETEVLGLAAIEKIKTATSPRVIDPRSSMTYPATLGSPPDA